MVKGNPRCRANIVFPVGETGIGIAGELSLTCSLPVGHEGHHSAIGSVRNYQNKKVRVKTYTITWDTVESKSAISEMIL
jgi:hypothetical protein